MPEFRGVRTNNTVLSSKISERWKSIALFKTEVDDTGIVELCRRAFNLTEVHISSERITDKSMNALCTLPKLRSLLIDGAPGIGDRGVTNLRKVKDLRELYLNGTGVTDSSISSIASLANLWSLSLGGTKITDTGVMTLSQCPPLGILVLERNQIRGSTLQRINLGTRANLSLGKCPIDDEAIKALIESHPSIETLDLSGTLVTDECMALIATLPGLCWVVLSSTAISDAGIAALQSHKSIREIYVADTAVSDNGVSCLRQSIDRKIAVYV